MKRIFGILVAVALLVSCATNRDSNADFYKDDATFNEFSTNDNIKANIDLTTHLRSFAGLTIMGERASAKLSVRGINSFTSGTEPLLILDGGPVSSYYDLYHSVHVMNIKNIRVLKNPNETAIYGVRGANGVISITTKKG